MSTIKLKIDLAHGLVEIEGGEEFVKAELPTILGLIKADRQRIENFGTTGANGTPSRGNVNATTTSDSASTPSADLGEFFAKANPETQHEIVATFAYFCAFIDKSHGAEFKNNEVVSLFTGVVRRANPSEPSKLCANCYNEKKWIRPGAKRGYWQISESGQKLIDGKVTSAAATP